MIWKYCLIFCMALSCDLQNPTALDSTHVASTIQISLPKISATPMRINRVELKVFGAGMDTLKKQLDIVNNSTKATGQVKIPAGTSRTFKVDAYMDSVRVYSGQKTVNIQAGKVLPVVIPMDLKVTALTITPNDTSLTVGSEFTVKIKVNKATNLTTLGALLKFASDSLQVKDLVREDTFLKSGGGSVQQIMFSKDNSTGQVKMVLGILPAANSVSGDGYVGKVTFKALTSGTTRLRLEVDPVVSSDLGLYNQTAQNITAFGLDGVVVIR